MVVVEEVLVEFVVEVDTVPPVITVLGSGERGATPSGVPIMSEYLLIGAAWTDSGATALDDVDGDLTR